MDSLVCVGLVYLILPVVSFFLLMRTRQRLKEQQVILRALQQRIKSLETPELAARDWPFTAPAQTSTPETLAAMSPETPPAAPPPPVAPEPSPPAGARPSEKAAAFERIAHAAPATPAAAPPPLATHPAAPRSVPPLPPRQPRGPASLPPPLAPWTAPKPINWEQLVGLRLFVWLGAIALALAGIFLVKYFHDQGIFTPARRLISGLLFAGVWLGLGQWRARRNPYLAQGFSAAGVSMLFTCFLAATNLYHLLDPKWGFVAMAATTALAVVLSLQQGPLVAMLGLVGGFLTPALINTGSHDPVGLFGYLFLLQAALLAVARRRGWSLLAALTVLGSMIWVVVWIVGMELTGLRHYNPEHGRVLGIFILASVAALLLVTVPGKSEEAWTGKALAARLLTWVTVVIGLILASVLLSLSGFTNLEWAYMGLLGAGCVVLGRLRPVYEGLAWVASALILGLLIVGSTTARNGADPFEWQRWALLISLFGGTLAVGAYACLWGSRAPVRWAALSLVSALGHLLLAYGVLDTSPRPISWAFLPLGLAALYALAAVPIASRRRTMPTGEMTFTALLLGIVALLAIAVPMAFEEAWLSAVWSLLVPLAVLAAQRLRVPALLYAAAAVAALVVVRLLANPAIFDYPTGPALFWNPIVHGYGIPLLSFAATAWLLRRGPAPLAAAFEIAPQALGFAFLTLMIRRFYHPTDLAALNVTFWEVGSLTILWLLLGGGLLQAGLQFRRPLLAWGGRIITGLALIQACVAQLMLLSPDWPITLHAIPLANELLYVYSAPVLLILLLAWQTTRRGETQLAQAATVIGLGLLWAFLTVEVRHCHHLHDLRAATMDFSELGSYPAAWLLLGWLLWTLGQRWLAPLVRGAGTTIVALGLLAPVAVSMLIANPRWWGWSVGQPHVFNWLLYVYGLPALLAILLVWDLFRRHETRLARSAGIVALLLLFTLLTLEVRQWFQGPQLDGPTTPAAELYAYSVAWASFGILLLVLGITTRGLVLRGASMAVMMLTAAKVFLIDASDLHDLYRVLSFMGLGLSLLALAYVYQRFVFGSPSTPTDPTPTPTDL